MEMNPRLAAVFANIATTPPLSLLVATVSLSAMNTTNSTHATVTVAINPALIILLLSLRQEKNQRFFPRGHPTYYPG